MKLKLELYDANTHKPTLGREVLLLTSRGIWWLGFFRNGEWHRDTRDSVSGVIAWAALPKSANEILSERPSSVIVTDPIAEITA